ncbi:zinc finger BED domain-containing protein RICESLEEPER 3-like [Carya illinoinensis]|uniref:zinc finger BED domain-containing protein RICESLEEPER 3-like n=1 Tax=Carya illinoinensis TaxID=32201 RepID=UPI001C7274BB|nr:zinc finger BED domain-containing protein RICESLEEPER 3-like [Carya illinoinensis]
MGIGDLPPPSATPSQPRNRSKRSWTWEHFTKISGNRENPQARCHHCGSLCGCHSKKQGTAVLIAHLGSCQRYKMSKGEAINDQTKLSYEASTATNGTQIKKMVIPQYSEKLVRDMLAEMIIKDEMPFTTVDKRGFRKFVKTIEPRFTLPSRYTVMRNCMKKHAKKKAEMKKMFTTTN